MVIIVTIVFKSFVSFKLKSTIPLWLHQPHFFILCSHKKARVSAISGCGRLEIHFAQYGIFFFSTTCSWTRYAFIALFPIDKGVIFFAGVIPET